MKKLVILLLSIIFLSGCGSYKELGDLGIVSALGIEMSNDKYLVTTQIANTKKADNTIANFSKVVNFSATGSTIFEAIRKITTVSSKKMYFPHMRIVIIDADIINNLYYSDILDFLLRDAESMVNYYVLVTDDYSPKEILETLTPFEDIPGEYISNSLKNSEISYGTTNVMTFEKYASDSLTNGIEPIFTKIGLSKNTTDKDNIEALEKSNLDTYITLGNLMVRNNNKELEELSEIESITTNFIRNNTKNILLTLDCSDNNDKYTLEMKSQETNLKFDESDNKIIFETEIEFSIGEYKCDYDLSKEKNINLIKKETEKYIEKNINNIFKKSQEFKTDFLGVGKYINSVNPNYFKNFHIWNDEGLTKLKSSSKVKVSLNMQGNLGSKYLKRNDENGK